MIRGTIAWRDRVIWVCVVIHDHHDQESPILRPDWFIHSAEFNRSFTASRRLVRKLGYAPPYSYQQAFVVNRHHIENGMCASVLRKAAQELAARITTPENFS